MIIVCFCLCLDLGDSPTGNQTLQEAKQGKLSTDVLLFRLICTLNIKLVKQSIS